MPIPDLLAAEIYKTRLACGRKLQNSYVSMLDMFDCVLTKHLNALHPYALEEPRLKDFGEKTKIFSLGGIGNEAKLSSEDYAYRVVNKGHLPDNVKFNFSKLNKNKEYFWRYFRERTHYGTDWARLKDYAQESYPSSAPRDWFSSTWWTDFPLFKDIILGAYTIGMFAEVLIDQVVLLRVRISDLESLRVAHVPTVIDAFMQPVFQPVSEMPPPDAGITIDLSEYRSPRMGVSEFVIHPISVDLIDIKPIDKEIDIDLITRNKHPRISEKDPDVLTSLLSYYSSL